MCVLKTIRFCHIHIIKRFFRKFILYLKFRLLRYYIVNAVSKGGVLANNGKIYGMPALTKSGPLTIGINAYDRSPLANAVGSKPA